MIRYLKQYDNYSCAPVAIINAFKWLGFPASKKHLNDLKVVCDCTNGTKPKNILTGINWMKDKFDIPRKEKPGYHLFTYWNKLTLKNIESYLKYQLPLLVCYGNKTEGHIFLITERSPNGGRFKCINLKGNTTECFITRNTLKKICRQGDPFGWVIKPKIWLNTAKSRLINKQQNTYSCVPIAIKNTFKCLGINLDLSLVQKKCKVTTNGATLRNANSAFKYFQEQHNIPKNAIDGLYDVDAQNIRYIIFNHDLLVFSCHTSDGGYHLALIYGWGFYRNKLWYQIANLYDNGQKWISEESLNKIRKRGKIYGWIIDKSAANYAA